MQKTSGIHAILSLPSAYDFLQRLVTGDGNKRYVREHLAHVAGKRILDIGCGTSEVLEYLPPCDYLGVDLSAKYVERGRQRPFKGSARLVASDVTAFLEECDETFDIILIKELLHHLDDDQAEKTVRLARNLLAEGGEVVALDPVRVAGQSFIAKWMVDMDRGRNVRTPEGYKRLFENVFGEVEILIRHDLLRIPYSLILTTARPTDQQEVEAEEK